MNNSLASMRYIVEGRPVSLSDIHIPLFAVGTLTLGGVLLIDA